MKRHQTLLAAVILAALIAVTASAAPLDDAMAAFAKAQPQGEPAVLGVLEEGIREGRSAQAFVTVASLHGRTVCRICRRVVGRGFFLPPVAREPEG